MPDCNMYSPVLFGTIRMFFSCRYYKKLLILVLFGTVMGHYSHRYAKNFIISGEANLDSPDSPMADDDVRTDPGILDRDDPPDTDGTGEDGRCSNYERTPTSGACGFTSPEKRAAVKGRSSASSFGTTNSSTGNGPTMPPVYHTVKKLRQAKLVVRHLNPFLHPKGLYRP